MCRMLQTYLHAHMVSITTYIWKVIPQNSHLSICPYESIRYCLVNPYLTREVYLIDKYPYWHFFMSDLWASCTVSCNIQNFLIIIMQDDFFPFFMSCLWTSFILSCDVQDFLIIIHGDYLPLHRWNLDKNLLQWWAIAYSIFKSVENLFIHQNSSKI